MTASAIQKKQLAVNSKELWYLIAWEKIDDSLILFSSVKKWFDLVRIFIRFDKYGEFASRLEDNKINTNSSWQHTKNFERTRLNLQNEF